MYSAGIWSFKETQSLPLFVYWLHGGEDLQQSSQLETVDL
jgi:hypothetical protein